MIFNIALLPMWQMCYRCIKKECCWGDRRINWQWAIINSQIYLRLFVFICGSILSDVEGLIHADSVIPGSLFSQKTKPVKIRTFPVQQSQHSCWYFFPYLTGNVLLKPLLLQITLFWTDPVFILFIEVNAVVILNKKKLKSLGITTPVEVCL